MPIGKTQYGVHEDVLLLAFGFGDIRFSRAAEVGAEHESTLIFTQDTPHTIGEESSEFDGRLSDDLPSVQMVMKFTKPESIAALIHSLVEIQKDLFRAQNQPA